MLLKKELMLYLTCIMIAPCLSFIETYQVISLSTKSLPQPIGELPIQQLKIEVIYMSLFVCMQLE